MRLIVCLVTLVSGWRRICSRCGSRDDDHRGTNQATIEEIAALVFLNDGVGVMVSRGDLTDSFVSLRVEGLTDALEGLDAVLGESLLELTCDHLNAFDEALTGFGTGAVFEGAVEVVEDGEHVDDETFVAKFTNVFFVTLSASLEILVIGGHAKFPLSLLTIEFVKTRNLGFEICNLAPKLEGRVLDFDSTARRIDGLDHLYGFAGARRGRFNDFGDLCCGSVLVSTACLGV